MFKSNLLAGLVGMVLVIAFMGIICAWLGSKAIPLIIICIGVMLLMIYDFWLSMREIRENRNSF